MQTAREGGSVPKHLSLVPLWPERQAALQAITVALALESWAT